MFASVLGVTLFDDEIPLIGWAGIAVIIASGIGYGADRAPASAADHFHRVSRQELNMPFTTLVTVEQLQEHLDDPAARIIDVRHDLMDVAAGPRAYSDRAHPARGVRPHR